MRGPQREIAPIGSPPANWRCPVVEEEARLVGGAPEEAIDVVLELDDGAHVVVEREGGAAGLVDPGRELVHAAAVIPHLGIRQRRTAGERHVAPGLNGVRGFAVHEREGVELAEELHLVFGPLFLFFDRVHEQLARVPPRHEREPVPFEDRPQLLRRQRILAARLRARIARLRHLRKAGVERRIAAELREIVVRPRDGGDAESCFLHLSRLRCAGGSGPLRAPRARRGPPRER